MRRSGILAITFSAGLLTVTALAHNQSSPKAGEPQERGKNPGRRNLATDGECLFK
jgi:hypothetical protein